MAKITVQTTDVTILKINDTDYISLTDIAKYKTTDANTVIANWLRNRMTIEYLGLWEILYTPFDGATYDYYTTVKGIFEKVKEHAGDIDFAVQPELLSLLSSGDFGRYANAQGDMNVCFISNNDITGGNSGSAMFNAKGELLGLAFDGNWEAMSSDIVFEPDLQRCIGVDVRYMLFIMEKYGKAGNLVQELKIAR